MEKTITSLIEKNRDTPYIHKFRVLHIIKGDFQFIAKCFYSYKMMGFAEHHNLITDEQYGGCSQRMVQLVVLHKIMYHEFSHHTMRIRGR